MSEWPKNFNKSKAITFIVNYKPQIKIDPSGVYYEPQVPKALFFSEDSFNSGYAIIYPKYGPWNYTLTWDGKWDAAWLRAIFPEYDLFNVLCGETILYVRVKSIGEGMAKAREIIISNGDSPEWTRLDFETFSNEGKIIKSFIDVSIGKSSRVFDFQRKCWFLETDVVKPLLEGFKTLITQGTLKGYTISDNRETIEAFEDFFNKDAGSGFAATPPKAKAVLISDFIECLQKARLDHSLIMSADKGDSLTLKPLYRKAALALHPDRNNGDGSKMSELNSIWNQLQQYL